MENLIPQAVVQLIAAVAGSVVTVGLPLIYAKLSKIDENHTALFGVDNVESMEGILSVVENHDDEIDQLSSTTTEIKDKMDTMIQNQKDIRDRVKKLEQSTSERRSKNDS